MLRHLRRSRWLVLLGVGLYVEGCSAWTDWLRTGSPHRGGAGATAADVGLSSKSGAADPAARTRVVRLAFDVVRVDLPFDDQQHSRKIWNHVDELRVDAELVARLARNGIRAGAASSDAWPAIQAVVELALADVRRDRLIPVPGSALAIQMGVISEDETVFNYAPNGGLTGKTFPAGEKILTLDYVFHPELGGGCDLEIGLEIRRDLGELTWENRGGVIRQVPALDRHVFASLRSGLKLNSGEFLVIGLGEHVRNDYLVGSRFLSSRRSGRRYETLLCVTPRSFSASGTER